MISPRLLRFGQFCYGWGRFCRLAFYSRHLPLRQWVPPLWLVLFVCLRFSGGKGLGNLLSREPRSDPANAGSEEGAGVYLLLHNHLTLTP